MPRALKDKVASFLEAVTRVLAKAHNLNEELFLQVWKLTPQNGADTVSEHLDVWTPELGLGVWPLRKSPSSWNEELMVDAAAAVFKGGEPELPSYRILHLKARSPVNTELAKSLRGLGVVIHCFSRLENDEIAMNSKMVFPQLISNRSFKKEDFYLPLLDRKTLESRVSKEQLDQWLIGVDVYIRESPEDRSILILSRLELASLLSEAAAS